MRTAIKKYWFLFVMALCNLIIWLYDPEIGKTALAFSGKNFINFLFILSPVFICIGLMDVWVEREKMIRMQAVFSHHGKCWSLTVCKPVQIAFA